MKKILVVLSIILTLASCASKKEAKTKNSYYPINFEEAEIWFDHRISPIHLNKDNSCIADTIVKATSKTLAL